MWRFLDSEYGGGIHPFNNYCGKVLELVDFSRENRVFSIQDLGKHLSLRRKSFISGSNYRIEEIYPFFTFESGEFTYPTNERRDLITESDFKGVLEYANKRFPKISQEVVLPYQVGNPDLHKVAFLEGVNIGDVKRVDFQKYQHLIAERFRELMKEYIRKKLKGDLADRLIEQLG